MQIRDKPKKQKPENKTGYERRANIWKRIAEKDGLRVHWLLLCAALRSLALALLQWCNAVY